MIENSNEKIIQIDTRINAKAKVLYIWKHWENYVLAYKKIPATNIYLERLLIYQSASKYLHISKYLLKFEKPIRKTIKMKLQRSIFSIQT